MKSFFLFTLVLFIALTANAQKKERIDVIYLKTDSVLEGNITDSIPGVSITVRTLDDNYHFVPREDILRIEKKVHIKSAQELEEERQELYAGKKPVNYWLWLRGGGGLPVRNTSGGTGNIDMINGIRMDDDFCFGIGIGTRFESGERPFLVPIYVQFQSSLVKANTAPMIGVAAGVAATPNRDWKLGAPFIRAEIGMQTHLGSGNYFTLTAGYERLNYFNDNLSGFDPPKLLTAETIILNVGFMF